MVLVSKKDKQKLLKQALSSSSKLNNSSRVATVSEEDLRAKAKKTREDNVKAGKNPDGTDKKSLVDNIADYINSGVGDISNSVKKGTIVQDTGKNLFGGTSKLVNSGLATVEKVGTNISNFGNEKAIKKGEQDIENRLLKEGKGLFGSGGIYKSFDEGRKDSLGKNINKIGGTTLQAASEVVPIGRGAKIGLEAGKVGLKVVRGAIQGGTAAAAGSVGSQIAANGNVDLRKTLEDTATGSVLGGAFAGAGHAVSKAKDKFTTRNIGDLNKKIETAGTNDPNYVKENGLGTDAQPNPQRDKLKLEAAQAVNDAKTKVDLVNEQKLSSPYFRKLDELNNEKQKALDHLSSITKKTEPHAIKSYGRTIEMTPENGYTAHKTPDGGVVYSKSKLTGSNTKGDRSAETAMYSASGDKLTRAQFEAYVNGDISTGYHQDDIKSVTDAINKRFDEKKAALDQKNPQEAAQAPQVEQMTIYATKEHMDAQKRLDEVAQEDQANADTLASTPDPAKVAAHQAELQTQKDNIIGTAREDAAYASRNSAEANTKIDDITNPEVHPENVSADGTVKPEAAKQIQAAQVERAQARVDNPSDAEEQLFAPTTGKEAPNATITRIQADKSIPKGAKDAITNLTHEVHDDKILKTNANKIVNHDVTKAHELFNSDDLVAYNPDSQVALGNALVDAFNKADQPDLAGQVFDKMLTTVGNAARGTRAAASISKISPQGIVSYAEKLASKKGVTLPNEVKNSLKETAKTISKMDDGPEKEAAIRQMLDIAQQKGVWEKSKDLVEGLLSLPRTIMTSADFSFGLRQGAILGARYPKIWAKAEGKSARMAVDENYFKQEMDAVANGKDTNGDALLPIYKKMNLAIEGVYGKSEETFGNTSLAESKLAKKLVVGHIVAGSDRAFTGAATVLRSEVAKKIINDYGGVKAVSKWSDKALSDLGKVIDTATGRGRGAKGGVFEKAAPALGHTLFSARLWKSRLDTLNPVYYASLTPPARKLALQSAGSFATIASLTLAAAAAAGADVETDPRSSDFAKIKVGDTRYDILGGLQQNIVLAARELTGQTKSTTTGEVTDLGSTPFGPDRLSILGDFVQNKESPIVSTASTLIKGTDRIGNVINPWQEVAKLFIPLGLQDTISATKASGGDLAQGALKASPGFLGVGANTYDKNNTSVNISDKYKVDAAPPGAEDQYKAFYGAAKNVTGRKSANAEITKLYADGEPAKAKRKAAEFNAQVDEKMASYYAKYPNIDPDLMDELNSNLYITITDRGAKQRARQ